MNKTTTMIRIHFLMLFVIVLTTTGSIAQTQNAPQEVSTLAPQEHSLDGNFEFSYQGTTHQIAISDSSNYFVERDQNGTIIGAGTYYFDYDRYVFVINEVSQQSFVNENLQVRVIEKMGENRKVIVQPIDARTGVIIDLVKL